MFKNKSLLAINDKERRILTDFTREIVKYSKDNNYKMLREIGKSLINMIQFGDYSKNMKIRLKELLYKVEMKVLEDRQI